MESQTEKQIFDLSLILNEWIWGIRELKEGKVTHQQFRDDMNLSFTTMADAYEEGRLKLDNVSHWQYNAIFPLFQLNLLERCCRERLAKTVGFALHQKFAPSNGK